MIEESQRKKMCQVSKMLGKKLQELKAEYDAKNMNLRIIIASANSLALNQRKGRKIGEDRK